MGRWIALLAMVLGLLTALPASATQGTTTADVPTRGAQTATVLRTSTADAPVQVNVDIGLAVRAGTRCRSDLPGVCTGNLYHPCFNLDDPAYAACAQYTLFQVLPPGLTELAHGITVPDAGLTRSGHRVRHGWGGKVTEVALEVYADDPLDRYGDVRLRVRSFPDRKGSTRYSAPIGHLGLPLLGAPDTGLLVGRAVDERGRPLRPRSVKLDLFGHGNTAHRTGLLGGQRALMTGFGGATVRPGTRDGSFRTKPLWRGAYDLHVQRRGRAWTCPLSVPGPLMTFDLDFRRANLGHSGCHRMQPLVQGVPD